MTARALPHWQAELSAAIEAGARGGPEAFRAAVRRQRIEAKARQLGVDADALARGHLIYLDRTRARFDQYADDTAEQRFERQWGNAS